jgi:hypothetical protein
MLKTVGNPSVRSGDQQILDGNLLFDDGKGIADKNGNEVIKVLATASAVNEIEATNAAAGNAPSLSATGSDTNIDLKLSPKGTGLVEMTGKAKPTGYVGRAGLNGAYSSAFNINWTGNAQLWIDTTFVGDIQLSSDYRIKHNVEDIGHNALARIQQIRPVSYQRKAFGNLFFDEEEVREGFIAHELAAVIPSAVQGEKDAENQIQSLRLDALCAVLVKAVQELKSEFDAYKASH